MKTTIAKNTIIEAEKLATLYAGDLRGKGYTPSDTDAVTSDKVMRLQFQNGVLNTALLPVGKLKTWVAAFPSDTRFELEFSDNCQQAEIDKGAVKIIGVTKFGGRAEMVMRFGTDCETWRALLADVPAIRFDDKHTGEFQLEKPAGMENLSANLKAAKAAKEFAKLRAAENQAKENLKVIAREHCANLETVAGGIAPAIATARAIVTARRQLRAALKNPMAAIPCLGDTISRLGALDIPSTERFDCHGAIILARSNLAAYKPQMKWDGYDLRCAKRAGLSIKDYAAQKNAEMGRTDYIRPSETYGPKFDALKNLVATAENNLRAQILKEFSSYCEKLELPRHAGGEKLYFARIGAAMDVRPYSRARIAVRGYAEKKAAFAQSYVAAITARRKAQPKAAAAGGAIVISATKANGEKIPAMLCAPVADFMQRQIDNAHAQGATVHILESNHPAFPVGNIAPPVAGGNEVATNETSAPAPAIEPAKIETASERENRIVASFASDWKSAVTSDNVGTSAPAPVANDETAEEQRPARVECVTRECSIVPHPTKAAWFMVIESADTRGTTGETLRAAGDRQHCEKWLSKIQASQAQRKAAPVASVETPLRGENVPSAAQVIKSDIVEKSGIAPARLIVATVDNPAPRKVATPAPQPEPESVTATAPARGGWAMPLRGDFGQVCRDIARAKVASTRAAKLAKVSPLVAELPEPEKPFEIARAELESKFADGWQKSIEAGSVRGESGQDAAPVETMPATETPKAPPVVWIIRRDERGEIINGNFPFREATGPVVLPPIPGSARDIFERAGATLAALMAGDTGGGNSTAFCAA